MTFTTRYTPRDPEIDAKLRQSEVDVDTQTFVNVNFDELLTASSGASLSATTALPEAPAGNSSRGIQAQSSWRDKQPSHVREQESLSGKSKDADNRLEKGLKEDVYSLLYTTPMNGPGFLFSVLIFILQTSLIWMLFFDLFDTSENPNETNGVENRMRIPPGVEYTVSVAQFLCLTLSVVIMIRNGDAMDGISQLAEGYDRDIMQLSENATKVRWLITALLQIANGLVFLFLTFVLTMQSANVLSLFLNFTSLHLLQQIDNLCFAFAASGILGKRMKRDCLHVTNLKRPVPHDTEARILSAQRYISAILTIALLVPLFVVVAQQRNGRFLCSKVYVQFGDQIQPQYAYYSGIFERRLAGVADFQNQRPTYIDLTNTIQLAWCSSEQAWTFSETSKDNSCDYIFKSASTLSFDVLDTAAQAWFYNDAAIGDIPVDWLKIACNDCDTNERLCHGDCIENTCYAKQSYHLAHLNGPDDAGRLGLNFEYQIGKKCLFYQALASTGQSKREDDKETVRFTPLISGDGGAGVASYVIINGRQVFSDADPNKNSISTRILLFAGRRWIIFDTEEDEVAASFLEPKRKNGLTYQQLASSMKDFSVNSTSTPTLLLDIRRKGYSPEFFSSAVNFGTLDDSSAPSQVTWVGSSNEHHDPFFGKGPDETMPAQLELKCSSCNPKNPCEDGGICKSNGQCQCTIFHSGDRCEDTSSCNGQHMGCLNDGICDQESGECRCPEGYSGNLCQIGPFSIEDYGVCKQIICNHEEYSNSYCTCGCFMDSYDTNLCGSVLFYHEDDTRLYHLGFEEYKLLASNSTTYSSGAGGGGGPGGGGDGGGGGPGGGGEARPPNGGGPPGGDIVGGSSVGGARPPNGGSGGGGAGGGGGPGGGGEALPPHDGGTPGGGNVEGSSGGGALPPNGSGGGGSDGGGTGGSEEPSNAARPSSSGGNPPNPPSGSEMAPNGNSAGPPVSNGNPPPGNQGGNTGGDGGNGRSLRSIARCIS